VPHEVQPYYVRDTQPWAVQQEHLRHDQALFTVGEYAMFVLMWHNLDFEAGLVARCARCYVAAGKIGEVYKQPTKNRCPECFGTTYEGGFKARIVRPAIFADTDEEETVDRRGVIHRQNVSIESTSDFRIRAGDFCFRADGTRWWLRGATTVRLRSGFGYPSQEDSALNINISQASLEDDDTVAYLIPPSEADLASILVSGSRHPLDFTAVEEIRAPLISGSRQP
jgi:hypothetical protein